MSLIIKKYADLAGPFFYYDRTERLWFSPSKWLWLRETADGLIPLNGVTGTVKIVDKSEALMGWAKRVAFDKFRKKTIEAHLGPNGTVEMFVTEMDALIVDAKRADKQALDDAGEVGHVAHDWIESLIKSILAKDAGRQLELLAKLPEDERASNACIAAVEWMIAHDVKWIATERHIFSREFGFAGTMDGLCLVSSCSDPSCCRAKWVDHLSLCDWKTSNYLYNTYWMQCSAYVKAHEEETGDLVIDRWINRLGKDDAEFESWYAGGREPFEQDWDAFHQALLLTRSLKVIDARIDAAKNARRADAAAKTLAAKEARLKIECEGFKRYKGIRQPKCNGGVPCESCTKKYIEEQAKKN